MNEKDFCVLIPAYKPDDRLVALVKKLISFGLSVVVVDDGGGQSFRSIFSACQSEGAQVVVHAANQGKGRALKTGINYVLNSGMNVLGVVTADADGQHTPEDILKVIEVMKSNSTALVLGSRAFKGKVPFKSRAGNAITRCVYALASGIKVFDTQTGLRGLPFSSLEKMMQIDGEKYEYEMNMLMKLKEMSMQVIEVPIETIYIDDNKGSHFNPIRDAWRIYKVILSYAFASISSFILDYGLYLLFLGLLAKSGMNAARVGAVSYVCARVVSSFYNYKVNKHAVFGGRGGKNTVYKYYALMLAQMGVGAGLTALVYVITAIPVAVIKLPIDVMLFFCSYIIQRDIVFYEK